MGTRLMSAMLSSRRLGRALVAHTAGPSTHPAVLDRIRNELAITPPGVRRATFCATDAMDLHDAATTLGIPATVVVGRHDRVIDPDRSRHLASCILSVCIEELEAGHHLPIERPHEIATLIDRVFDGVIDTPRLVTPGAHRR